MNLKSELLDYEVKKIESRKRQDYVQFLFEELNAFKLYKGIQEEIEQDYQSLKNADELRMLMSESIDILQQDNFGIGILVTESTVL